MIFSSFEYVFFLIIVLLLYWRLSQRFRIPLLLLASYLFYMSWSPPFGLIYGPVIFLDSLYFYWLSRAIIKWPSYKKRILIFGIVTELCLLGYFKYITFLSGSFEAFLKLMHLPSFHMEFNVFLPLAISFTNFILISYLVDVYRGDEKPDRSFLRFATYVAFFPHLIAGPIVRARELLHQFDSFPEFEMDRFFSGIHKFFVGLTLKLFVADLIAPYVNTIYGDPSLQGFDTTWVATYGFAIQIFCDFAGYTLMAQGSALMLGYRLPENFNAPYFAKNITDFWRRWHMSLSRWLKDYLYIPLGGSRCSRLKTYCNLFITMGLGGLWHGASWNFVIWGLFHGMLLSLHKFGNFFKINRFIPESIALLLTFHAVCIGWVFFRGQTFKNSLHIMETMFNPSTMVGLSLQSKGILGLVVIFFAGHWAIRNLAPRITNPCIAWVQGIGYFLLIYLGITLKTTPQEFIYFQF